MQSARLRVAVKVLESKTHCQPEKKFGKLRNRILIEFIYLFTLKIEWARAKYFSL